MITKQTQIKINLSEKMKKRLQARARDLGVPTSFYVKHLILKDSDEDLPVFEASKATEDAYWRSIREEAEGKLVKVDDIDRFFDEL